MLKQLKTTLLLGSALLAMSQTATARDQHFRAIYEVSITNLTLGQSFTPQLVTTHHRSLSLYELGQPASEALEILAESGNTEPMTAQLLDNGGLVADIQTIDGLLTPGQTTSVEVGISRRGTRLSIASMLIPTNDTFVGGDALRLPRRGSVTYYLKAYDAGTEFNDQNCLNIPGPRCKGAASSAIAETDEGYVYVSNGFHTLAPDDTAGGEVLSPAKYSWQNPVAKVVVKRIY